jgi:predicted DNA-binding transcriptional regulator YafY
VRSRVGPWATIEEAGDDRCVLRMSSESLDWPMMALGIIGAEFDVVGPPELTDHLRERIDRFGRAVGRS